MNKLTFTMENYLEAIYELTLGEKGARVSDIAEKLGVTKASTTSAMSSLSEKGLITNERYKEIFLTKEGLRLAELTAQKHQVILKFLTEILNVDSNIADVDACSIEHVISKESIIAMQSYMQKK